MSTKSRTKNTISDKSLSSINITIEETDKNDESNIDKTEPLKNLSDDLNLTTKIKASEDGHNIDAGDFDLNNDKNYNKFLLKKELLEHNYLKDNEEENSFLYPNLNDPLFNVKIATKKEFNDTQYDASVDLDMTIEEQADVLSKADFELAPHQAFVRNFMSFQTPYNSLLLYHGLGSGKTCSAIGVCEEMRDYLKQMGITKRIIIVASPNVQDSFKLQLFNETKLKLVDGMWNIRSCTGNKFIKEINPMNMKGLSRDKVISKIKTLINNSYMFLGYESFANYIKKVEEGVRENPEMFTKIKGEKKKKTIIEEMNRKKRDRLNNEFNNRLIVIDEVHNIRITDDNENKKVAIYLSRLVECADNLRLLFLSATPMYNSYKEIIFLLNLMNENDRRAKIEVKQVFDKNGNFKEGGRDLLIRKATGYVSFVRGENPFTFPYKVYPKIFSPANTFGSDISFPSIQMNGKDIEKEERLKMLDVYLTKIGDYQSLGYRYIIDSLRKRKMQITTKKGAVREMPSFENMESFGYTILQPPLEALIIVYPYEGLEYVVEKITTPIEEVEVIEERKVPEKVIEEISSKITNVDYETVADEMSEKELYEGEEKGEVNKPSVSIRKSVTIAEPEPERKETKTNNSSLKKSDFTLDTNMRCDLMVQEAEINCNEKMEELRNENKLLREQLEETKTLIDSDLKGGKKKTIILSSSSSKSSPQQNINDSGDTYNIDPIKLVGKKGLERVMTFVDTISPLEKGSFAYKPKYANLRIFSRNNIGKYSSKIKSIIETIMVSKGVILIYSQYIDGGLIPMALALEELGFIRYGEGAKNLFTTPPSEAIDVRTMKPKIKGDKNFMPARYIMITGDPRISPNNAYDVTGVTQDENMNGEKIKVILISQAGSEGIDFKFIRQVHILEPWYNMNRIEQIVGRAVRNFSHKELPFKERNVEVFLHGTLLEDKKEEAADIYVYRVAEQKAIQIGKITRLLKETSVDCILNYEQNNFTQKNFEKILKQKHEKVEQILSTGKVIKDFKIGDQPYTAACDYMETCEYKCQPNKEIKEEDLIQDTYNESYIMMNSEKIFQKIRNLFGDKKEGKFFFIKTDLINQINSLKKYPLVQIYAALTQLIDDENEYIVDKYGRTGRLINVGDYYLFQPSELDNKNISIFDRSVPIDFKREKINLQIKGDIKSYTEPKKKHIITKEEEKEDEEDEDEQKTETSSALETDEDEKIISKPQVKKPDVSLERGNEIFREMKDKYDLAIKYTKEKSVPRGDKDENSWYKHCGITMRKMITEDKIPPQDILIFLTEHINDMLVYKDKIDVLNYLYSLKVVKDKSFEEYSLNYYNEKIIRHKKMIALELYDDKSRKYIILNEKTRNWSNALPEDIRELNELIDARPIPNNINNLVGFIDYEVKTGKFMVFKVKDMLEKRHTGARCDGAGKKETITLLNRIVGEEKYTKDNTKGVIQEELCSLQEFTLRYYNKIKKDNKIYFLDLSIAKNYGF